ncbi:metallophosphoesterase [Gimibacter soli]|uniref:Metallophosphoesterase n=1 Tax=Gimibacter soli TaxID=3024400 RepID=A0AAF0BKY3_9PROT|nr:metallophosphoesterase [Gimibacter soli]WCL54809.1 metallophosphoesterase [Gimibacter soli]
MPARHTSRHLITLPPNRAGRDFLVGDLHGMVQELAAAMQAAEFDKAADRIISVGDLVDRGPDSLGALRLTREPWFFAVRGNHEIMMLDADGDEEAAAFWYANGGRWFTGLGLAEREEALSLARALPTAIRLERSGGKPIGVTHAEPPPTGWRCMEETIGEADFRRLLIWSRDTIRGERAAPGDPAVALTVHGHTPIKAPKRVGNALFIDTGCVYGGRLTLIEAEAAVTFA